MGDCLRTSSQHHEWAYSQEQNTGMRTMTQKSKHRHEVTFGSWWQCRHVGSCLAQWECLLYLRCFPLVPVCCLPAARWFLPTWQWVVLPVSPEVKDRHHRQLVSRAVCENTSMCHVMSFTLLPPPDSYFLFHTTCMGFSMMTTLRSGFFFSPGFWTSSCTWKVDDLKCGAAAGLSTHLPACIHAPSAQRWNIFQIFACVHWNVKKLCVLFMLPSSTHVFIFGEKHILKISAMFCYLHGRDHTARYFGCILS